MATTEKQLNENQKALVEALKQADGKPMTLEELGGFASGTMNSLVKSGIVKKAGQVKKAVVRYVSVETYILA